MHIIYNTIMKDHRLGKVRVVNGGLQRGIDYINKLEILERCMGW